MCLCDVEISLKLTVVKLVFSILQSRFQVSCITLVIAATVKAKRISLNIIFVCVWQHLPLWFSVWFAVRREATTVSRREFKEPLLRFFRTCSALPRRQCVSVLSVVELGF